MGSPTVLPCSGWATATDVTDLDGCDTVDVTAGQRDDAVEMANYVLYVLSGRQFPGICTDTVRPCCQTHVGGCGCILGKVELGRVPVVSITSVKVDGAAFTDYRIDDYRYLVRTDRDGWPLCQDLLGDPDSDSNTFEVTFTWGKEPGDAGVLAAARLACEITKSLAGNACKLPDRVQQITRQGITAAFIDPLEFLDKGQTGITSVDLWLKAVNPTGTFTPPKVISPESLNPVARVDT